MSSISFCIFHIFDVKLGLSIMPVGFIVGFCVSLLSFCFESLANGIRGQLGPSPLEGRSSAPGLSSSVCKVVIQSSVFEIPQSAMAFVTKCA